MDSSLTRRAKQTIFGVYDFDAKDGRGDGHDRETLDQVIAAARRPDYLLVQLEQSFEPLVERFDGLAATGIKPFPRAPFQKLSALQAAAMMLVSWLGWRNRWAKRVMPAVLQRLMRHAEIATTMKYYATMDADTVADELWGRDWDVGDNSGNNRPSPAQNGEGARGEESPQTPTQ